MNKIFTITIICLILLAMPLHFANAKGVEGAEFKDLYIEITSQPSGVTMHSVGAKFYSLESENGQNKYGSTDPVYMCEGTKFKVYINAKCSASTTDWACPEDDEKDYWKHDYGYIPSTLSALDKTWTWEYNGSQYDEAWSAEKSIDNINTSLQKNIWAWTKIYEEDCLIDCDNAENDAYFTVKKYECCRDDDCKWKSNSTCDIADNTCKRPADLEITEFKLNDSSSNISVQNGSTIQLTGKVKNSGEMKAAASTVTFFYNSADVAPDALNSTAVKISGIGSIDALAQNATDTFLLDWTAPGTTGVYYLWAWVDMPAQMKTNEKDYPGSIAESNGTNNLKKFGGTLTLTATPLVDLTVASVNIPQDSKFMNGNSFTPVVTIKNIGTKASKGEGQISWFNNCGPINNVTKLSALAVGQSKTFSPATPIKINKAGSCTLNILINGEKDSDGYTETNLGNNSYDLNYDSKSNLTCEGGACELDCSKSFCDATQILLTLINLEKAGYFPTDTSQKLTFKVWALYDMLSFPNEVINLGTTNPDLFIKRFVDVYGGFNTKGSLFITSEAAGNNRDFAEKYFIEDSGEQETGVANGVILDINTKLNTGDGKIRFEKIGGLCTVTVEKGTDARVEQKTDKYYNVRINCDDSYLKTDFPYLWMPLDLPLISSGPMSWSGLNFNPLTSKENYNSNILTHRIFNSPVSTIQQLTGAAGYGAVGVSISSPGTEGATENEMLLQISNVGKAVKNLFVEHTGTNKKTLGNFYEDMFNLVNKSGTYLQKSRVYYDSGGNMHLATTAHGMD